MPYTPVVATISPCYRVIRPKITKTMNAPLRPLDSKDIIDLRLSGMTCAACAARIEKSLNRLPGVAANVNLATERAHVRAASGVTAQQLIDAVRRAGYAAEVIVGMDTAAERARRNAQYRRELFWFWISVALSAPLLLQMGAMFGLGHADILPRWLQLVLATPVQFWIGRRFYVGAWHALRGGGANMDVLIVLGTTMAWAFSAVVTLLGVNEQHVYFEAG